MAWSKLKSMFVVSDDPAKSADDVLKDLEKYQLPPGDPAPLPEGASPQMISGQIDFQALYDQAGIPNTDEVEALERFLTGLDESLPAAAKVAAAKAFLGAIGKAPKDVVTDAGRKITVVRAVTDAKRADTEKAMGERQAVIADLQRQVDEQRSAIQALQGDLESARSQCAVEESRLQGARMFFGQMADDPPPQGARRG
ncbi:MAG TPA: hypothetical protein VN903_12705 [Polyangia bacterium]|jgi:hypothetical protein|nr:hypothetical protein [Polyangia bacterium]